MQEIKYRSAANGTDFDPYIGQLVEMTPTFPQGVDKYGRIGNKIQYKFVKLDEIIQAGDGSSGVDPTHVYVRRILFWTRVPIPTPLPANFQNWGFLWDDPGSNAFMSTIRTQTVRIVSDKLFPMAVIGKATQTQLRACFRWKKRFRVFNKINFTDSTQQLPSDPKDKLYCLIVASSAVNDVTLYYRWHSRFSFYDI